MKKLQLLVFLCLCYARALWAGRARGPVRNPKRICVIQLAKLGDMVCTTPVFAAIKKQYPQSEVWVVGDGINKAILAGHPHVNGYIVSDKKPWQLMEALRPHRFDAIIITAPHTEALAAAYLAGAPLIVAPVIEGGWSPFETRSYVLLRRLVETRPHTMGMYAPRQYLRLLEPLGIEADDTTKTIAVSEEARSKMRALFSQLRAQGKLVGIAPGAGNKVKQWPPERFAEVARYCIDTKDASIIIFGGPKDALEVEEMMRHIPVSPRVLNTASTLSVEELKAAIAELDLFVSVDTGPIYIAEAWGVATIDIVGPMDEREQPPIGGNHRVVVPDRDAPALHIMNARVYDQGEALRQVAAVPTASVLASIDALL